MVTRIKTLYSTLLEIEQEKGEKASELYFDAYLSEEIGKNYDEFVVDLFEEESKKQQTTSSTTETKTISEVSSSKNVFQKSLNWFFFGEANPT